MPAIIRRSFLKSAAGLAAGWAAAGGDVSTRAAAPAQQAQQAQLRYGLVTYLWGQNWDLPTLLRNCAAGNCLGVELRTTHKHGVEPSLNKSEREEIAARFDDSPVELVGIGSNERFDDPDPKVVAAAIAATRKFIELSHDVGGSGVKVKPDRFHASVPRDKTIAQIGASLREVATFAAGYGQQIRLEVHGQCGELPTIRAILDAADHDNVYVCWNSNPQDLQGEGLEHNFELVRERLGATVHVRELDTPGYPYPQLIELLVKARYQGWIMTESSTKPQDPVAALRREAELLRKLTAA